LLIQFQKRSSILIAICRTTTTNLRLLNYYAIGTAVVNVQGRQPCHQPYGDEGLL
jgi:hypothetical protein